MISMFFADTLQKYCIISITQKTFDKIFDLEIIYRYEEIKE